MSVIRPDLLSDLPEMIAGEVKTVLPELRDCKGMAGPFNLEELKVKGVAAPAVFVSVLGLRPDAGFTGSVPSWKIDMAAYVVTKDSLGLPRDLAAANICQSLLVLIPNKNWGEDGLGEAEKVAARSLVTAAMKKLTTSLWAVTWEQPVVLHGQDNAAPMPIELYVGQSPDIGAGHEGDYELIGGAP